MNKHILRGLVVAGVLSAAGVANATAPDFSSITAAVDWSGVATGILAIAALLAVVLVVKKGARMVLSMLGR